MSQFDSLETAPVPVNLDSTWDTSGIIKLDVLKLLTGVVPLQCSPAARLLALAMCQLLTSFMDRSARL